MKRPSPNPLSLLLLIPCLILAAPVRAESVKSKCPDLEKCAHLVAALTGGKYIYDGESPKGVVRATENFEMTKENADEVFTLMLNQEGYTRLPLSEPGTYTILRQRDARDSALPLLVADPETTPDFPKNWDLATLRYKLSRPEGAEPICRNIRAFMPGNSRVVPDAASGQIFLVAPYPILATALQTIRSMDAKPPGKKNSARY